MEEVVDLVGEPVEVLGLDIPGILPGAIACEERTYTLLRRRCRASARMASPSASLRRSFT